ncbi:hypothetical protein E0W68_00115 [Flavobacterium salilacus subsp. salilacus]|uniref:hypothetical protein n=1 Tax=Flavobacterium TaxID=237 RepID=UPI0010750EC8|nr:MULTISPECIES: hypothetical protein [Flavobacterium]KAF2519683.1 hypothetical protein E0W68_00115 [Flavobacterium salilacus subsp. salilacus]MBE1614430.1 hypothetical protein [Flavobacterium sp. SaA2.13]
MRRIISLVMTILLLICSCKKEVVQKPLKKQEEQILIKEDTISDEIKTSLLDEDIDVKEVLSQIDDFTSGFIPKAATQIYPANKKNKFFVHYLLIKYNSEIDNEIAGRLVVYDSINPQYYGVGVEDFMDIYLYNESLSLYNGSVKVGMKYQDVIEKFGNDFIRVDSTLVYRRNERIAFFKIKDSIVSKIRIGNYRNDLNENEILNDRLW